LGLSLYFWQTYNTSMRYIFPSSNINPTLLYCTNLNYHSQFENIVNCSWNILIVTFFGSLPQKNPLENIIMTDAPIGTERMPFSITIGRFPRR
jgi:hypothetical protein